MGAKRGPTPLSQRTGSPNLPQALLCQPTEHSADARGGSSHPKGVRWQNLVALQSWQPPLEGAEYWEETQSQILRGCLLLRHLGPYSPRNRKENMNNLLEKYLFNCKAFTVEVPAWV